MGETEIDAGMFMEYLQAQGRDRFRGDRSFFDLAIVTQPKAYPVTIQQYILHCIRTIWKLMRFYDHNTCRYDLLNHNCNNFSHETAQFLTGRGIPQHILDLPREV